MRHIGGEQMQCRVVVWNPEGKRPCGRQRCRWESNVKVDLKEMACMDVD
jgi:hypothetical protein